MSHTVHISLRGRIWALAAALLAASGLALATAAPAHAHDELIGSEPAQGATVDALPAELTLTFSAAIADQDGASIVEVTDASGTTLADGSPSVQDNVLTQALEGEASGAVTVLWKVVSSDGHPISGEFTFTVGDESAPGQQISPQPTGTELTDDMSVDWGATLLANLLPVLLGAAVMAAIIVAVVFARRRRGGPRTGSGPGSAPPADH